MLEIRSGRGALAVTDLVSHIELLTSDGAVERNCRRFINDGQVRCRIEYGTCGRDECGKCFQASGKWQEGVPFVPEITQLHWINEFLQTSLVGSAEYVATVAVTARVKPKRKIYDGAAEEGWFGY